MISYVDDKEMLKMIKQIGDCVQLQSDLDNFYEWCLKNKLPLSLEKSSVVTYYRILLGYLFSTCKNFEKKEMLITLYNKSCTFKTTICI